VPEAYRSEFANHVYGCDICQDVCPWNRGVEKRRAGAPLPDEAEPVVSLLDWLEAPEEELRRRYDRLYFPRNDARYLRRNALVAAGNSGEPALAAAVAVHSESPDELLSQHARWAAEQLPG
jgi:epoxyqueuosine reductase